MRHLLFLLPLLLLSACQSTTKQDEVAELNQSTTATLYWTGEIAADGCGFEIEVNGKRYLPENEDAIPAKYKQQDSSRVRLVYEPLPEPIDRQCGMLPQPRVMPALKVKSVESI